MKKKLKIVITGSEGQIGKALVKKFGKKYQILKLDRKLGHDLTEENFVKKWFAKNRGLSGVIISHAYNPLPVKKTRRVEPTSWPMSELRNYLEVNVTSAFSVTREFIRNNKSGRIIFISSIYGIVSPRHDIYRNFVKPLGYSVSKGAIRLMTKYLAAYYAPQYLINNVSFGGIEREGFDKTFIKNYESNIPAKRMMKIEEAMPAFEYLLDPHNTHTIGAEIITDGGWTIW